MISNLLSSQTVRTLSVWILCQYNATTQKVASGTKLGKCALWISLVLRIIVPQFPDCAVAFRCHQRVFSSAFAFLIVMKMRATSIRAAPSQTEVEVKSSYPILSALVLPRQQLSAPVF